MMRVGYSHRSSSLPVLVHPQVRDKSLIRVFGLLCVLQDLLAAAICEQMPNEGIHNSIQLRTQ